MSWSGVSLAKNFIAAKMLIPSTNHELDMYHDQVGNKELESIKLDWQFIGPGLMDGHCAARKRRCSSIAKFSLAI